MEVEVELTALCTASKHQLVMPMNFFYAGLRLDDIG
jgi:hypothetical protein